MMERRRAALRLVLASLQYDQAMMEAAAEGHDPIDLLMAVVGYAQDLLLEIYERPDEAVRWVQRELLGAMDDPSTSSS